MSLECQNETIRFDNATLRSIEEDQSFIGWFIGSCVLSTSLVANGWVLAVGWGSTYIDGIFKYPVCYLAFCDVLMAVVQIAQSTLHQFTDASTYLHYCAVPHPLTLGAANAMLLALIPTPLQRCLMFVDVPWLSDHARQPRSIVMFSAVLFIVSVVPPVGSILAPPDRCVNGSFCAQMPVNKLFYLMARLPPALSYVATIIAVSLFVWKVKDMQSAAAGANVAQSSSAEVNINRDILAMAVVQTINPIVLTAPVVAIGLAEILGFAINPLFFLLAKGMAQLNVWVDALSTIYFIKPYRRLALKTAKRIRQIISKPNAVSQQTPAVIVNVEPAGTAEHNNDWRVTIGSPTQMQPLPPIERY